MEIAKLLKIEMVFDAEKEKIEINASCTQMLKDLIEETNSEREIIETLTEIEIKLHELMSKIDDKMEEE